MPAIPDLVPQQAWEFRGTVERPLLGDGLAKLDVGYDLINDLQDRVLIFDDEGNGFDAPGNLGTGKRYFAHLTLDAPLARLGLKGVRVKFDGQSRKPGSKTRSTARCAIFPAISPTGPGPSTSAATQEISPMALTSTIATGSPFSGLMNSTPISTAAPMAPPSSNIGPDPGPRLPSIWIMPSTRPAIGTGCCSFPTGRSRTSTINEFRERNRHLNFGLTLKQTFGGGGGSGVAQDG